MSDDEASHDRWAFGTGFIDPRASVNLDAAPPPDAAQLAARCLMLGDDALIYSHRLQQWVTRAPELEEETALANIALDLLGQARLLLSRAGHLEGAGRDEDRLAFFRDEHELRNVRLVESQDRDFAHLVSRLFLFSVWRHALLDRLRGSVDPALAAIAERGAIELVYHRDYAAGWVIRLGDGTELSRERMRAALSAVWPSFDELFRPDPVLEGLPPASADPTALRAEVLAAVAKVLTAATLEPPSSTAATLEPPPSTAATLEPPPSTAATLEPPPSTAATVADGPPGRDGRHSEDLAPLLAELQSVARAHPLGTW